MSWLYLILAIGFEVTGTLTLKMSQGFSNIKYVVALLISYGLSLILLSLALKKIDIGIAYAIWSGMGITAIEVLGVLLFKESMTLAKIVFIAFIMVGTIGLNLTKNA